MKIAVDNVLKRKRLVIGKGRGDSNASFCQFLYDIYHMYRLGKIFVTFVTFGQICQRNIQFHQKKTKKRTERIQENMQRREG